MFSLIVAVDQKNGIAKNGKIPWHDVIDMKHFHALTKNNVVIMGRKTFESIGKPLANRLNIIITRRTISNNVSVLSHDDTKGQSDPLQPSQSDPLTHATPEQKDLLQYYATHSDILIFNDIEECAKFCMSNKLANKLFVIGGSSIYKWFKEQALIKEEYITFINEDHNCDQFYETDAPYYYYCEDTPTINQFSYASDDHHKFIYRKYFNQYENQMLWLMNDIMTINRNRDDRTGVGTISSFGHKLEFNLDNNTFPLMTTRKIFFRGIFEELMMFIRGQTNTKILESKNITIWRPNTSREFLDKNNLQQLPEGDMGHSYGFSLRHFGADYKDCTHDYKTQGHDQLSWLINEIKQNPHSRRLLISLWEPNNMHKTPLPPCLYNYQFYVDTNNKTLSCMMTQRSSDFFTAGGWNVATGSLLTILIAHVCNLKPHRLIWNIGDVHVYQNLIQQVYEQTKRIPKLYPKLYLRNTPNNIEDFTFDNLELVGYQAHTPIKGVMNA